MKTFFYTPQNKINVAINVTEILFFTYQIGKNPKL